MPPFSENSVLITGATGALGQVVCRAFLDRGARIALVARERSALADLRSELESELGHPDRTEILALDLLDPEATQAGLAAILERFGPVHTLINIAGGFTMGPAFHETPLRDWEYMMNLNARSVFLTCRALIPRMLAEGSGCILNVSARAARQVKGRMAPYRAAKAAVISLTESLALEYGEAGIRVNCILPGTIDTPQNRAAMPDADWSRWVPPAALADVLLFLVSDAARCINGAAIPVYGRS